MGKEDPKKPRSTLVIAVVAVVSVVSVIAIGVAAAIIIMSEYFYFARDWTVEAKVCQKFFKTLLRNLQIPLSDFKSQLIQQINNFSG